MVDTWHFSKGNPDFALLKSLPGDCLVSVQVADAIRDPRAPMALVAASISAEGADYIKNLVGHHPIQRQAEPMEILRSFVSGIRWGQLHNRSPAADRRRLYGTIGQFLF
jgi:uncharacterized protein (UPF0264 family)